MELQKKIKIIHPCNKRQDGLSVIEIIVAMAIFSLVTASITSLIIGSFSLLSAGSSYDRASYLAQEGLEAARAIRDRAWNELVLNKSAVTSSGNEWNFTGEGTSEQIGIYSRSIYFYPVFRDVDDEITASTSQDSLEDINTKKVRVEVEWTNSMNVKNTVSRETYLTNWNFERFLQDDWSGGSSQIIFVNNSQYESDDGNIFASSSLTLLEIATSTYESDGFLISSAYNIGLSDAFSHIEWSENIPETCSNCEVRLWIMTTQDSGGSPSAWPSYWSGPDGKDSDEDDYFSESKGQLIDHSHNGDQWIRYKVELISNEDDETPTVDEVRIFYKKI